MRYLKISLSAVAAVFLAELIPTLWSMFRNFGSEKATGLAALIATHNLELAAKMDRALVLHEGRLIDGGRLRAKA